ncbi:triose-phosphate isomerase [Candidatus Saccharibacteria bacterium]|nr:triose-phosphate isomerase [Candidatus Saccharibacteria bacterium]
MSTHRTLIVGNWKMHLTIGETSLYLDALDKAVKVPADVEAVIAPTTLALQSVSLQLKHHRKFKLAAQNCFWRDFGAYTGEVSAHMLRGLAQYVILGHSERRHLFGEIDKDIRLKVQAAVRNQMQPILCVGETGQERLDGDTGFILHDQVTAGLANITSEEISRVVIAYEPVWAIGTGDNAKPHDVTQAMKLIRKQVRDLFGKKAAEDIRLLYGGSVDNHNAADYLALPEVDGLLVGGASLKPHVFAEIIAKARKSD